MQTIFELGPYFVGTGLTDDERTKVVIIADNVSGLELQADQISDITVF